MEFNRTKIEDCIVIYPKVFHDNRGFFYETYNSKRYLEAFIDHRTGPGNPIGDILIQSQWRQTNCSVSKKNVVRGIHVAPFAKLVTCLHGNVWDVVVDMRPESKTYLQWVGIELGAPLYPHHVGNISYATQVYVPPGCGHGFFCRQEGSVVSYSQTGTYDPAVERTINWRDTSINIEWPEADDYVLSARDESAACVL